MPFVVAIILKGRRRRRTRGEKRIVTKRVRTKQEKEKKWEERKSPEHVGFFLVPEIQFTVLYLLQTIPSMQTRLCLPAIASRVQNLALPLQIRSALQNGSMPNVWLYGLGESQVNS
jgi:hypothetical protein